MNPNYTTIHFKYKIWLADTLGYSPKEVGACITALMIMVPLKQRPLSLKRLAMAVHTTPSFLKKSNLFYEYFDLDGGTNMMVPNDDAYFLFDPEKRTPIPKDIRQEIWDNSGGGCFYCGCALTTNFGDSQFHVDHIIPFSKGGSNDIDNLAASCRKCNLEKGAWCG